MATSTTEASITEGKFFNSPVKNRRQAAIVTDAIINETGVLAPASSFTADCDKPPLTGYPLPKEVARFANPRASNSWWASIS